VSESTTLAAKRILNRPQSEADSLVVAGEYLAIKSQLTAERAARERVEVERDDAIGRLTAYRIRFGELTDADAGNALLAKLAAAERYIRFLESHLPEMNEGERALCETLQIELREPPALAEPEKE
jgi:hypothetical protein